MQNKRITTWNKCKNDFICVASTEAIISKTCVHNYRYAIIQHNTDRGVTTCTSVLEPWHTISPRERCHDFVVLWCILKINISTRIVRFALCRIKITISLLLLSLVFSFQIRLKPLITRISARLYCPKSKEKHADVLYTTIYSIIVHGVK